MNSYLYLYILLILVLGFFASYTIKPPTSILSKIEFDNSMDYLYSDNKALIYDEVIGMGCGIEIEPPVTNHLYLQGSTYRLEIYLTPTSKAIIEISKDNFKTKRYSQKYRNSKKQYYKVIEQQLIINKNKFDLENKINGQFYCKVKWPTKYLMPKKYGIIKAILATEGYIENDCIYN